MKRRQGSQHLAGWRIFRRVRCHCLLPAPPLKEAAWKAGSAVWRYPASPSLRPRDPPEKLISLQQSQVSPQ